MTKAGRWLRVSTSGQDEQSQQPDIDRWIEQRGYEVAETYRVHGESAYHGKQEPELRRAMADVKAGRIEVLVCWKSDRLERRGAYALMGLIREAVEYGGRIEFVTEPALNNASDPIAGPMLQAFYGAMGHHESKTKSDRTSLGQAQRRAVGSFFGGDKPYGYDSVALDDGRRTIKPNADAPVVARIFEEAAAGATFYKIAKGLTADGIPTPGGKALWSETSLSKIIKHTAYRGLLQHRGVTYLEVEPIVSASTWLKANEASKSRAKRRGGGTTGRPTSNLLRPVCGECEGTMYRYGPSYRCAGLGPEGNTVQRLKGCGNIIRVHVLDAEVTREFEDDDEPYFEETLIAGADWSEAIAGVQLQIKDLDQDADDYDERHAALRAELKRLKALPVEPPRIERVRVDFKTEGDAFREMTPDERRVFIRRWTLTVFPVGSDDHRALVAALKGRRWDLSRKS